MAALLSSKNEFLLLVTLQAFARTGGTRRLPGRCVGAIMQRDAAAAPQRGAAAAFERTECGFPVSAAYRQRIT